MRNRPLRLRGGGLLVRQVYLVHVVDLLGFWLQPDGQETLYVKGVSLVAVRQILVVGVLRDVVLVRQERPDAAQLENTLAAVQDCQLIHAGKLFATLSSDEFKKTAAAKKNLCGCRSNWRLEAKKSPVVPGK